MQQQLVGFLAGGFAVISGDGHIQAGRQHFALQRLHPGQHGIGHHHGIGARPLGYGDAHSCIAGPFAVGVPGPAPHQRLAGPRRDGHPRHIRQQYGPAGGAAHGKRGQAVHIGKPRAGGGGAGSALIQHCAGRNGAIGRLHGLQQRRQRDAVRGQFGRIGRDMHHLWAPACHETGADILDPGKIFQKAVGHFAQAGIGPARRHAGRRREREHQHRHIIDAAQRYLRITYAGGPALPVGGDAFGNAGGGIIGIGTNGKARRHHHHVVHGLGVDMIDAADALHDAFQRHANQIDRALRLQAGGGHDDVHHRHADLRFFLPRDGEQRDQAHGQRRQQQQRRER